MDRKRLITLTPGDPQGQAQDFIEIVRQDWNIVSISPSVSLSLVVNLRLLVQTKIFPPIGEYMFLKGVIEISSSCVKL